MAMFNKKFVFSETFTNTNGKTSGSGFIGVILGLIAGAAIIATMIGYFLQLSNTVEVMGKLLELVGCSTLLLGVRKVASRFGNNTNENNNGDEPSLESTASDKNKG